MSCKERDNYWLFIDKDGQHLGREEGDNMVDKTNI